MLRSPPQDLKNEHVECSLQQLNSVFILVFLVHRCRHSTRRGSRLSTPASWRQAGGPLLPGARICLTYKNYEGAPFLAYFARSGAFHVHLSQTSQRSRRTIPECSFRAYALAKPGLWSSMIGLG